MTTVTLVTLKDIREKEQLYIMIENNGIKEAINVGTKTFERIKAVIQSKPAKDEKQLANKMEK